jgi:hypothetical protein
MTNPYVGPRTFTEEESNRFFGREREARELYSLVVSERLVLFYAQSGAGKSSLLNARIIPRLKENNFEVLPVGRVSGEIPEGVDSVNNIFVFNLMAALDQKNTDPNLYANLELAEFLAALVSDDGQEYYFDPDLLGRMENEEVFDDQSIFVLLIDQFEEIITTHPGSWQDRDDFFRQLNEAMAADPSLWVVLTLREDFVAGLDPYAHLVFNNMRSRFYMQRMKAEAALEAVNKPMELYGNGRSFAPGVAEALVDNLRQIRGEHGTSQQLGEFVEPVQLQVVCYQLWENLKDRPVGPITQRDLAELGNVDTALAQFYDQALADVVDSSKGTMSQRELRNWVESELITEAHTRGIVYRGNEKTAGLDNNYVHGLQSHFLLRSLQRAGSTWYELIHDRFVDPILQSNQAWRGQQGEILQAAEVWHENERDPENLYKGFQLVNAWSTYGKREDLEPLVREFIDVSRDVRRKRIWRRFWYVGLGIIIAVALFLWWALKLEPFNTAVAFTPEGSTLIVTSYDADNAIYFYDFSDLDNPIRKSDHEDYTAVVAVSPDGNTLATGSGDYTIRLWDLNNLDQPSQVLGRYDSNTVQFLAFSPDGQLLASAGFYGSEIYLWDLNETNRSPQILDTEEFNNFALIEFSPDGQYLVAVDKKEGVFLWELSNLDNGPLFLIDTDS